MSETDICNSALIKLGAERILDLNDESKEGRLCKEHYPRVRDKLLRSHPWNFATQRLKLAKTTNVPVFQFDFEYQLPGDFLYLTASDIENIRVRSDLGIVDTSLADTERFRIEKDKLLSNSDEVHIEYVALITDTTLMDPNFRETLSDLLASDLAYAIVQSQSLAQALFAKHKDSLREARTIDAQQGSFLRPIEGSWIATRFS